MDRKDQIVLNIPLASIFYSGRASGRFKLILNDALDRQRECRSFWFVVPDIQTLDYCVALGIKPSNIRLPDEFTRHACDWQAAHVGIFEDTDG